MIFLFYHDPVILTEKKKSISDRLKLFKLYLNTIRKFVHGTKISDIPFIHES